MLARDSCVCMFVIECLPFTRPSVAMSGDIRKNWEFREAIRVRSPSMHREPPKPTPLLVQRDHEDVKRWWPPLSQNQPYGAPLDALLPSLETPSLMDVTCVYSNTNATHLSYGAYVHFGGVCFPIPHPHPLALFIFLLRPHWGLDLKLYSELHSNLSKAGKRGRSKQSFSQVPAEPPTHPYGGQLTCPLGLPTWQLQIAPKLQLLPQRQNLTAPSWPLGTGSLGTVSLHACSGWIRHQQHPQLVWGNKLQ